MNLITFPSRRIRYIVLIVVLFFCATALASCSSSETPAVLEGENLTQSTQNLVVREISIDQAYQLYQEKVAFLDVRTPEEWNDAHVPGSTLLPLEDLENRVNDLPKDLELVVYCRSGDRSAQAARILLEAGFTDVYSMDGGLNDWITAGYEVDPGE